MKTAYMVSLFPEKEASGTIKELSVTLQDYGNELGKTVTIAVIDETKPDLQLAVATPMNAIQFFTGALNQSLEAAGSNWQDNPYRPLIENKPVVDHSDKTDYERSTKMIRASHDEFQKIVTVEWFRQQVETLNRANLQSWGFELPWYLFEMRCHFDIQTFEWVFWVYCHDRR